MAQDSTELIEPSPDLRAEPRFSSGQAMAMLFVAVHFIVLLLALPETSLPDDASATFLVFAWLIVAGSLSVFPALIAWFFHRAKHGSVSRLSTTCLFLGLVVIGLTGVSALTDLDLLCRLKMSEGALSEAVLETGTAEEGVRLDRRVGLFHVHEIRTVEGCQFVTLGTGLFSFGGVVYSPNGPPPTSWGSPYEHLTGPWWSWAVID